MKLSNEKVQTLVNKLRDNVGNYNAFQIVQMKHILSEGEISDLPSRPSEEEIVEAIVGKLKESIVRNREWVEFIKANKSGEIDPGHRTFVINTTVDSIESAVFSDPRKPRPAPEENDDFGDVIVDAKLVVELAEKLASSTPKRKKQRLNALLAATFGHRKNLATIDAADELTLQEMTKTSDWFEAQDPALVGDELCWI